MRIWHSLSYVRCIEPLSINVSAASKALVFPYSYPTICFSSDTILEGTSFNGLTCIVYYCWFISNPNPRTGRAISFILDDARHKKRGCADHPGKMRSDPALWTCGTTLGAELDDTKAHGIFRQIFIVHFLQLSKWNRAFLFVTSYFYHSLFKPYLCIMVYLKMGYKVLGGFDLLQAQGWNGSNHHPKHQPRVFNSMPLERKAIQSWLSCLQAPTFPLLFWDSECDLWAMYSNRNE